MGAYGRLSAVQFCSIIFGSSSLIAAAVVLLLTGACYGTSPLFSLSSPYLEARFPHLYGGGFYCSGGLLK